MGVPAFFRWLSRKYPSIVNHCQEERQRKLDDGTVIPVDTSEPNPNGYEFDNLYLDMNGIIHPCTHPENKPAPKNEAEMFVAIFEYIDRIFSIVRPRKVLYMAIDGVAPRAKMNQQRSRRFRAGKESREKKAEMARLRAELLAKGAYLPPEKAAEEHFDSNCITPGTPFMARLATALRYYIHDRINTDPGWRKIKVILSDANVPGEGEHKIMDYIRHQRGQPDHDPNTRHCLCGADADLIMLGLATHEPHFTIIREEFKPNQPKPCELCGQMGHEMKECVGAARDEDEDEKVPGPVGADVEFIFIRLNVLREYLSRELKMEHLPFPYTFERALDDWVFMCFFVGNDFLPHLPSLEIRENAIDRLVGIYKQTVLNTGGWLTESGVVNLTRVQLILQDLGEVEDEIFKNRRNSDLRFKERQKREKRQRRSEGAWVRSSAGFAPTPIGRGHAAPGRIDDLRQVAAAERNLSNIESAVSLKAMLRAGDSGAGGSGHARTNSAPSQKRSLDTAGNDDSDEEPPDEVRLWEGGWKERYYQSKFGVEPEDMREFRVQVGQHYVRGLCWVLRYYYQGCRSWTWYFPYHYAPFASDFVNIANIDMSFLEEKTEPFKPVEQLMGVFPADSKSHVPEAFQSLMYDPNSPIIDFYPSDFKIDLNGKKYLWQGVALLPFVDEVRLLKALEAVYPFISEEDKERNVRGPDRLFCHSSHPAAQMLLELYQDSSGKLSDSFVNGVENPKKESLIPQLTDGVAGKVWRDKREVCFLPGEVVRSPISLCEDLRDNATVSVCYADPEYAHNFLFPAKLLPNVEMPPDTLKPDDFPSNRPYRPNLGFGADGGHRPRNSYNAGPMNRMARGAMGSQGGGRNVPPPQSYGSSGRYGGNQGAGDGYRPRQQYGYQQQQQQQYGYQQQQQYGYQQQQQQYGRQQYSYQQQQQQQQPYYQMRQQSGHFVSDQGSWYAGQRDPRQGGVYGQRNYGNSYPMPPRRNQNQQGGSGGGSRGQNDHHSYYN